MKLQKVANFALIAGALVTPTAAIDLSGKLQFLEQLIDSTLTLKQDIITGILEDKFCFIKGLVTTLESKKKREEEVIEERDLGSLVPAAALVVSDVLKVKDDVFNVVLNFEAEKADALSNIIKDKVQLLQIVNTGIDDGIITIIDKINSTIVDNPFSWAASILVKPSKKQGKCCLPDLLGIKIELIKDIKDDLLNTILSVLESTIEYKLQTVENILNAFDPTQAISDFTKRDAVFNNAPSNVVKVKRFQEILDIFNFLTSIATKDLNLANYCWDCDCGQSSSSSVASSTTVSSSSTPSSVSVSTTVSSTASSSSTPGSGSSSTPSSVSSTVSSTVSSSSTPGSGSSSSSTPGSGSSSSSTPGSGSSSSSTPGSGSSSSSTPGSGSSSSSTPGSGSSSSSTPGSGSSSSSTPGSGSSSSSTPESEAPTTVAGESTTAPESEAPTSAPASEAPTTVAGESSTAPSVAPVSSTAPTSSAAPSVAPVENAANLATYSFGAALAGMFLMMV
ncbi:hypothetical protein HYPBUDRAFT_167217 [Hyphopichia burtonii NRRL Y-1933]|uniref:Flo11 domain-containing protein n=1 Tax=Hyphopichia burtonii NRRL Y-1933 TaxID=984485 RepID=A0A1E4RJT9_9ASCO|nr:hypothetical protein HYPBUDRAFT_167217 [Hyphopichia burtonii NRRL Y-1933]ODV67355.1 hypothetical protein HYPBUDRAFT_167217 [Hyphopichia burtonii NRRL Y-1933]